MASLANNPSINIIQPIEDSRGNGFLPLLRLGLNEEILAVLLDMVKITIILEAYLQHTLINSNVVSLSSRRNEIHHRLLSLPSGAMLGNESELSYTLYECCRLAALAYATATLFALPPSTGVPQRLVSRIQSEIDKVCFPDLNSHEAKFYIWVLFLAGIWAEGMPERPGFIKRLTYLLQSEGIYRWKHLKDVLMLYLWMSAVCDEGGMILWDEVACGLAEPVV